MYRVKNRKVMMKLSIKMLKAQKKKNSIIILGIMLTCILFTTLFSLGGSLVKSSQKSAMRQVGGKAMAGLKYVLPEDYKKIKEDRAVKDPIYRILIGYAENNELKKLPTEVNFADDKCAKDLFSYPTKGTMPKNRLDLATSTLVLDALGLPYKIGETVTLKLNVDGKFYKQSFTLCGYWEGDKVAMAQLCWLSKAYCEEVAPTPFKSYQKTEGNHYAGYWMVDFNFSNSWDIKGKTIALLKRNGYDPNKQPYGVNWAYTTSHVDRQTLMLIVAALILILISGYLIIYNIFYINVIGDTKKYGLLKTIGTTGRQLKNVVRKQAFCLSFLGIPIGLLLGTFLSRVLLPIIMDNLEMGDMEFSISPFIYLLSGIFTYFTVWISSSIPCYLVAKVSPMEAVRYSVKGGSKRKEKKSSKISGFSLAMGNIGRTKKKVVIVVLSLSISMILVNSIYTLVCSFDVNKFVEESIIGDFLVTDASALNSSTIKQNLAGVSKETIENLSKIEGVKSISNIYCKEDTNIQLSDKSYHKLKEFCDRHKELLLDEIDKDYIAFCQKNRMISTQIYGMDQWAFNFLKPKKGTLDWDKFVSGEYAVVYTYQIQLDEKDAKDAFFYEVGDQVSLKGPEGNIKKYKVMAIGEIPYVLTNRRFCTLGATVVLPTQEYLEHTLDKGALFSILNVEKNKMDSANKYLEKYTKYIKSDLTFVSKKTYLDEFRRFTNMYWMVGGALSGVLAIIGILNFINAMVTSLITRRQEFAMLEAVGMTGRQLKGMLMWEGFIYAFLTIVFSATFGSGIGYGLVKLMADQSWFFHYQFTLLPIIICTPILVLFSCIVPYVSYQKLCKTSVVERLRVVE